MREKGITNPELLAPNAVVERISDAFASAGVIYNKVSKFETLDPWEQIFNIDMSDTAGAQVYSLAKIAANGADKTEQTQILVSKTVNPEIIYKYLPVPNRYSRYNANRTVLMQYLLGELPRRIVYALEKYIVLGDPDFITQTGGATQSVQFPNTTTPTSVPTTTNIIGFEGITQANPAFCWTIESSGDLYEDVINAMTWISYPARKTLITSAAQVAGLRTMKDSQGQLVYPFNVDLTQAFDVDEIETPQWFPLPANPGDLVAVVVVLPAYKVIGDLAIEQFTNFLLATNTDQYLAETFQGGALLELQSAVAITMASTTPTP
jgi:HK97 family phage major capsid protein